MADRSLFPSLLLVCSGGLTTVGLLFSGFWEASALAEAGLYWSESGQTASWVMPQPAWPGEPSEPQVSLVAESDLSGAQPPDSLNPFEEETSLGLALSAEAQARLDLLKQGDGLYEAGDRSGAMALYRQAKQAAAPVSSRSSRPDPTFSPDYSAAVKVYWREGTVGLEQQLESKAVVPLTILTEKYPEFIPGHLKLAEAHNHYQRPEAALAALERGASAYPNVPELQEALMQQQATMMRWLPAAITARQFAALNPDHPRASEFAELAEVYQQKFRATLREDITSNTIGSVLTGALNVGLGNPLGVISPIQNAVVMLRGENSVGASAAKSYQKRLEMLEDEAVNDYISRIGQKLAAVSGRDLDYEFFVVNDEKLNAFALPGGKIFIHSGAILKSQSEAELAGLIAHELSHAVLSHGFQVYTNANATGSLTQLVPFGGLFSKVAVTRYSREMEEQADLLGTRILANAGYAADGLENLTRRLTAEKPERRGAFWLSTHPEPENRIEYISAFIDRNGYNRYSYEGVAPHQAMQARVRSALRSLEEVEEAEEVKVEAELEGDRTELLEP
ncbi:M48 family metallopeptidase [Lyngbya confervoides]|uniref:M48 family metallopeptidase n=1 Tax=Lyngbya confervoides BDU141951 TaxID=1574623 RepID=A0ABD4SY31_9CYAN|nr:M48 family metallopeptidase [Lyngbya confervoides]MCM1981422.1 M48 family metallopeptidase [Lyngbya confervoides BDU141951]